MGRIINRTIEFFTQEIHGQNTEEYYFHGEYPRAKILIDDIFQCTYIFAGVNDYGEDMYARIPMRISHHEK